MRIFLLLTIILICLISCSKNNGKPGKLVEMYLLRSYQFLPNRCQVNDSFAILENEPLIKNDDIIQYSNATFQYQLTAVAFKKVKVLPGRSPFAITVDKKVIFYGVYMPSYMSSLCLQSITMGDAWNETNSIYMNLAYPGVQNGVYIKDQRNDAVLLTTFIKQGKLKQR